MPKRRDLEEQLADATARGLVATAEEIRRQIDHRDAKASRSARRNASSRRTRQE